MFKLWYYIYLFTSPTASLKGLFFMFPSPFPFVVFTNGFVLSLNKICSVMLMCCLQNCHSVSACFFVIRSCIFFLLAPLLLFMLLTLTSEILITFRIYILLRKSHM